MSSRADSSISYLAMTSRAVVEGLMTRHPARGPAGAGAGEGVEATTARNSAATSVGDTAAAVATVRRLASRCGFMSLAKVRTLAGRARRAAA